MAALHLLMVEGLRGFIPASSYLSLYIEDLETYLLKDIEVKVIDVDEANNRLVKISAREILREKQERKEEAKIAAVKSWNYRNRHCRKPSELRSICRSRRRSLRSGTHFPDQLKNESNHLLMY